jgi:PEP-CTERM motif
LPNGKGTTKVRATYFLIGLVSLLNLSTESNACHISAKVVFTRENGMNAINYRGDKLTLIDLINRRDKAPERFDFYHPTLGVQLAGGIDGLLEKQEEHPLQFKRAHPILNYLLKDFTPDGKGPTALGDQPPVSPWVPASRLGPQLLGNETTISAVPEPSGLLLFGLGLMAVAAMRTRYRRQL